MTCETLPAGVWPDKDPETTEEFGVDFTARLTRWWEPRRDTSTSTRVRSRMRAGYEYECTTGGQTGLKEPLWPTTVGQTVQEGSVTWTCRAISTASLTSTVSGVVWTPDTGITSASPSLAGQVAISNLSGGSDGIDYEVKVAATLADGRVLVKRCILPVRIAARVCCA
jgi:hypothetical protein